MLFVCSIEKISLKSSVKLNLIQLHITVRKIKNRKSGFVIKKRNRFKVISTYIGDSFNLRFSIRASIFESIDSK